MTHTIRAGLVGLLLLAAAPGEPFLDLSYEQAQQRAKDAGKLLLVDATASWCKPCKKMEKDTWPAQPVRAWLSEHAVAIQIDVDEEPELSQSLKIEAMPTVIAFKDGAEFDRVVGYKGPDDLLAWLEAVRAGKRSADAVREKAAALESSTDVEARYDLARELLQQGEHERALEEYLWLWPNSREAKAYAGVRLSFMLSDIRRLCDAHEPAREAFTGILDALDEKVNDGSATDHEALKEWLRLSQHLDDSRRVIAFYETHRNAEGRLGLARLSGRERDYVTSEIFDVLMERKRYLDAARLLSDLEAKAREEVRDAEQFGRTMEMLYADDQEQLASMKTFKREQLEAELSQLHAAALVVDRREVAQAIGVLLIGKQDNASSRTALVTMAIAVGRAGPEHAAWLDQAEQQGADVAALRAQLESVEAAPEPEAPR